MKKIILSAVALVFTASLFAIQPVKMEGDFNIKKAKGTFATYTIDMDNLMVGNIDEGQFKGDSEPLDAYWARRDAEAADGKGTFVEDWINTVKVSKLAFVKKWNGEFKKGLRLTEKEAEAQYHVSVKIDNIDLGHPVGMFAPYPKAGGAIVTGKIVITEKATNAVVLTVTLQHVQGYSNFSDYYRTQSVMEEICREIEDMY